jgi:hypothetical protein
MVVETIRVPKYSNGDIALTRVSKRRSESMKCDNCAWSTHRALKKPNRISIMQRLYVREKNGFRSIGWFCRTCGSVILDCFVKTESSFHKIPDPKITVKARVT